jgi:hypothetical protein
MVTAIRVAGPRRLLSISTACLLAACSGGDGGSGSAAAPDAPGSGTSAVGVWSGTLSSDDPAQPPLSGWLTITPDGGFHLDTDAALFSGMAQTKGNTLAATTTGHPYGSDFSTGSAFRFNGSLAQSALTGTWSGGGRSGSMRFQHEDALSRQVASLPVLASTYEGELWIGNVKLPASIAIAPDGSFTASTSSGCAASGMVGIADAARNRYQWTATLNGCGAGGMASGSGFMIGNYSVYLSGTLPDGAVWMGGVDADAPGR